MRQNGKDLFQFDFLRLTNTQPFQNQSPESVPSDRLWLRSELMGTQVITRDTGRRLGVVGEVVVDIDRREVVALGLRDNPLTRFLPGLPRWMPLDRIRQVGDVILVDSVDSLSESFTPDRFSRVINCQVITESGQQLGRVLGFSFDIETGELTTLVMGALGVPLLGEGVLSTWEITVEEIVSSGADRIIVYEGAEEKLKQLNSGFLEKLGVGGTSWEEQERERYRMNLVPVENQLTSGDDLDRSQRILEPSINDVLAEEETIKDEELEYVELQDSSPEVYKQRRYIDESDLLDDHKFSGENQNNEFTDDKYLKSDSSNYKKEIKPSTRIASRRAVSNSEVPLDVEPLDLDVTSNPSDEKNQDQKKSIQNEIDDPW